MIDIFLILTPAICFAFILSVEVPQKWREALFVYGIHGWRPPLFLITMGYGLFVKLTLEGVLGSYGIFMTDIALYPMLCVIAARTRWQVRRRLSAEERAKQAVQAAAKESTEVR